MLTPEIRFDPSFPASPDMRGHLLSLIRKWAPAFCPTISRIYVMAEDNPEGGLSTIARPQYRDAALVCTMEWMRQTPEEQEEYVVHEMAHFLVEPARRLCHRLLKSYVGDQETQTFLAEQLEDVMEALTEDIARAVISREATKKAAKLA